MKRLIYRNFLFSAAMLCAAGFFHRGNLSANTETKNESVNSRELTAAGSYSDWNEKELNFLSQTHLLYLRDDYNSNTIGYALFAEKRTDENRSRYLPSAMFYSSFTEINIGYRFLPAEKSTYLISETGYTGFSHMPHARENSSGFIKISQLFFVPGLYNIEKYSQPGFFFSDRKKHYFIAWHPPSRTGTLYWNSADILSDFNLNTNGEIKKYPDNWEGYLNGRWSSGNSRIKTEAERKKQWDDDAPDRKKKRTGELSLQLSVLPAESIPLRFSGYASGQERGDKSMRSYFIATELEAATDLFLRAGVNQKRFSYTTEDSGKSLKKNQRYVAGIFQKNKYGLTGISLGYDSVNHSRSVEISSETRISKWYFYAGALYEEKTNTPFILFEQNGENESSYRFYTDTRGSVLFRMRSDYIQLYLQSFIYDSGKTGSYIALEAKFSF
jgi:hypothetical protein